MRPRAKEPCVIASGISGYFDDAGRIGDTASLVVGGFVGNKKQWDALTPEWEQVLAKNELRYFHGAECEHGQDEFDKKRNDRWKNPRARSDCRMEFVEVIVRAGLTGIVAGVVSKDYENLEGSQRDRLGKAFSMVAQTLIVVVKNWANERHVYDLSLTYLKMGQKDVVSLKRCSKRRQGMRLSKTSTE
jgi:hypothetical protein